MYSDDLQNDLVAGQEEEELNIDGNLDLEESDTEDAGSYLVNDDELEEGFQFQG